MPSKRSPAERGYKQVMLNSRSAQALAAFCEANDGLSASAAVLKLISEGVSIPLSPSAESVSIHREAPMFAPDDFERMCLACRLTDKRLQETMRGWFAVFFGWDK